MILTLKMMVYKDGALHLDLTHSFFLIVLYVNASEIRIVALIMSNITPIAHHIPHPIVNEYRFFLRAILIKAL